MTTAEKVGQMVQAEISNVTPDQARDWNLWLWCSMVVVLAQGNIPP